MAVLLDQPSRQSLRALIDQITPFDGTETEQKTEVLRWIDSGEELYRRIKPATPPRHLVSYVLVRADDQLLLVDHIKAELWVPPGGHVDPGEAPARTAQRELFEELGLAVPLPAAPRFLTITETVGKTAGHEDVSLWFDVQVPRDADLSHDGREFLEARWFPRSQLPLGRTDPNLFRYCQKVFG